MNKRIYNLLKEKTKLERERDRVLLDLLNLTLAENEWTYTKRNDLLSQLKKFSAELFVIQKQLEMELSNELLN